MCEFILKTQYSIPINNIKLLVCFICCCESIKLLDNTILEIRIKLYLGNEKVSLFDYIPIEFISFKK